MPTAADFLPRLPKSASPEHRAVIEQAFNVSANFWLERKKITENPTLSPKGRSDALAALVRKEHAPQFRKLAELVQRHRVAASTARANLRPKPLDPAGELRRDQIRVWMRGLPPAERFRRALRDETIRAAIMDAPSYLSGLSDEEHSQIINHHMAQKSSAEIRQLDDLDETLANMDAAIQVARNDVLNSIKASGVNLSELVAAVSPTEAAA